MASLNQWVAGARPRTLPAAIAPVILGTAAAHLLGRADLALAILALLVALSLQVGVNYANDYSDGIRGTDEARVGPVRLVGQRLAAPSNVKAAAMLSFAAAAMAGLALVGLSEAWIMLPLGALSVLAAWRYTGGDNPYGYRGLGEVYVFVFFGLMATLGTLYTQADAVSWFGLIGAIGVGALASAILVANNLRDIPTDIEHGKRTLAVRLGDARTRTLYVALFTASVVALGAMAWFEPWALLGLLAVPLGLKAVRTVRAGTTGRELIPVLAATGLYEVAYAVLIALGVVIGVAIAT
ncbi:1,4-dihydroxy-2-naphthoate polyprenyltransferase [Ornithinibacter sp.]|uniref:1,4-dihydroxy-2-naphthoate polyprenyltransferase n=1 Tax=Ornithinibacter sp. TaxID=2862748 RepID=UPI002B622DDF|nr:1,4-dihydroxy-2-naphthoate polyprenyltransferase [Ornithinibacter sp.]HOB78839.1 1,4-dihydroxy-2-naphthoate polyprenyltransferase [Ornithinibacter sp.]HQA13320.1 1,4-dihydroxy-2-naphthoate polyprenyltransferase [Ornithinibacter sp.]HQD68358.1 1,4-dihydroxy-2-naphthoate polyprenyltransferase [Ornithinibacter sp.]HQW73461.1 1,4-dihydroxy-2-naphthoate polyprenyltransferase [Ornithinibacter sp.]HQX87163.1 1,4-dihydroxy-2-naphthoate polyprenyltransferase [Ornithinibacter sp.]